LFRSTERKSPDLRIQNPLAMGTVLKLSAFIAVVMLAAELLRRTYGSAGVLIVAASSGMADVDAVTISMARIGGNTIDLLTAAHAIVVAVMVNTVSKAALAFWTGGRTVGAMVGSISAAAIAVTVAAAL
jgi:uncharacterized membrane protein (DUF4010 family)